MAKAPGIVGGKALTDELRKLSSEVHTISDDGSPITRAQILAGLIWRMAIGWEETTITEDGNRKTVRHPPVPWAMQYVFERTEGKAAIAVQDDVIKISAAEKVRELSKARLNKLAAVSAMPAFPKKETNATPKEE